VVRKLYANLFSMPVRFKLWLAANRSPRVADGDDAFWRRIHRIPFTHFIPKQNRDPSVKWRLCHDPSVQTAILHWAVEGCVKGQEYGLAEPQRVIDSTREYMKDEDQVSQFISECCVEGPDLRSRARNIYRAYKNWAEGGRQPVLNETLFGRRLSERGYTKRNDGKGNVYSGIGVVEDAEEKVYEFTSSR